MTAFVQSLVLCYYSRGSGLFEALVFLSMHTYIETDIYLHMFFFLKRFPKIKYLGGWPIYLRSLGNYRNGYYTQVINRIYTHIKLFGFSV